MAGTHRFAAAYMTGIFCLTVCGLSINIQGDMKRDGEDKDSEGWEFGDIWKEGSPDAPAEEDDVAYVEVLRGDTGRGYDDTIMMDFVSYLGSRGIRATYDSFSLGLEPAAIKTYVLKVEAGWEGEALEYLRENFEI
jgi:hypothetical protein